MLLGPEEHLRLDVLGHEIKGVVPDLQQEIAQATDAIARLRFVIAERILISLRRTPLHSVETTRRAIESGKRLPTAVSFLDALIDQFADAIGSMAERLGNQLDSIEDRVMHGEAVEERPHIGRVRLQAVRVHRQLAQLRVMFHRLEPRMAQDNAPVAQAIQALAQKLDAIDHEIHSFHDRARRQDAGDHQSPTLYAFDPDRLLPAAILVTGFFGMNTKDMYFQNTESGTLWALGLAVAASALTYWALRRLQAF